MKGHLFGFTRLAATLIVFAASARAVAQETLAELGLAWSHLFTVADVDAIDAAAKLTPAQRADQLAEVDPWRPSPSKLRRMFYSRTEPGEQPEEDQ